MTLALRSVKGLRLLDTSSDEVHNRSVFTYAGDRSALIEASLALMAAALSHIDLRQHRGVHPRMGALDVIPFVPLDGASLDDCVGLAREVGRHMAARFHVPIFLYGAAASTAARHRLEEVRRGQFEGLSARMADPAWTPDFGPGQPHPSAGATAVGARPPLVAFNVNLETDRLDIARVIAHEVRERDGGLPGVKALGLPIAPQRIVQVSMNLTDIARTPPRVAFEAVRRAAAARGVTVRESELIGLIPAAALAGTSAADLQLRDFDTTRILEVRLARTPPNE